MRLFLKEVEPFNLNGVDDNQAALFLRHLSGNESFEFSSEKRPKSIALHTVKYKHPRLCSAHGWLLSVDINTFEMLSNQIGSDIDLFQQMLKEVTIGNIGIDLGGDLSNPRIYAH